MLKEILKKLVGREKMEEKRPPDLKHYLKEIGYWLDFTPSGGSAGRWLSKESGSGLDFDELVNFLVYPVSQQIDPLATLRTLSPVPLVRIFQETDRVNVIMIGDFSRSMIFGSTEPKTWGIAKLAAIFGYTAYRFGDRFSFYGCDEDVIPELTFPPQRLKTYGLEIGSAILKFQPEKASVRGLLSILPLLPLKRSLIILASDFRFPPDLAEEILNSLTLKHQVIPFVFRDNIEEHWPDKFLGLVNFEEMEGSGKSTVIFSPKAAASFGKIALEEKTELEKIFRKFDLLPVYLSAVNDQKISEDLERGRR